MTITQAFLTSEISNLWPDNTTGAITPANARTTLNDMVTAIFQGISPTALSTSNTWTASQTFTGGIGIIPPVGLSSPAIATLQSLTGTQAGVLNANSILISSDNANVGGNFVNGFNIAHNYGGAAAQGGRQTLQIQSNFTAATSASNTNRNYVGITVATQVLASDGGTLGGGNEKGGFFGMNPVAQALSGATGLLGITAGEADIAMQTGSSAKIKYGWSIVQLAVDAVQGNNYDAALGISNIAGAVGWKNGILMSASNGQWPISTTGNILGTADAGAKTIGSGIDLSGIGAITNFAFKSPSFSVDGSGNITGNAFNKVAITTPATLATLTISSGTTMTFPGTSDTLAGLSQAQTFTKTQTITHSFASGSGGLAINATQTAPNSSDANDNAFNLTYVISAVSATNELVVRPSQHIFTNSLTGGGVVSNARIIDIVTNTNAGTTTSNLECIYLEAGASSGTVTTGYGLHVSSLQGSTKWGIADDSGSNWYNATGGLSLGTSTAATATFLKLAAATTAKSQINFISSSGTNPSSPVDGDMWYDGTNLNFRFGGSTKTITHS